ncbi:hypothetical protein LX32DRAFT_673422 [Colletotrichum zoysiae]|uniref:Helicase ATP-binding domain-containing protein n=1 Tax=Colletotrichum zoysiae TaxID=1216348 RepID=A0AAD9HI53_9PEZI|nr:hypothetical protein LX32DRAFT_673422 [Colletotrichum zoysiae]
MTKTKWSVLVWRGLPQTGVPFPVKLESGYKFTGADTPSVNGLLNSDHGYNQMIQEMLDDDTLRLYVMCDAGELSGTRGSAQKFQQLSCSLSITVYGPADDFDEIGNWFQAYNVYLQDPLICHLDTRYCNPHKLSFNSVECCIMVSEIVSSASKHIELQDITEPVDMLDMLNSRCDLEEAKQPVVITAELKRHQKQALTFMLRRERGWGFLDGQSDIWSVADNSQRRSFVNMISGCHQYEEPPQFYGGIIADPMGLGKTLTMIALVATDLEDENNALGFQTALGHNEETHIGATLIIVPPPLIFIGSWEEQLSGHVSKGGLEYRRHHGKSRLDSHEVSRDRVNVVLTTYHTVSTEWRAGHGTQTSPLFTVRWRRIVLDEAHYIRNENSRMARAVCALDAVSRWAVTGTPIQNRLTDLAAIVKFIRAHPYTDTRHEKAAQRLRNLSACLILRRPKGTINLPRRHDKLCPVDFTREERAVYDEMRDRAIARIEEAMLQDSRLEASNISMYHNALQQIESLRLFCNLGLGYHRRHEKVTRYATEGYQDWAVHAQQLFNLQWQKGPIVCLGCSSTLEVDETLAGHSEACKQAGPRHSRCLQFSCGDCVRKSNRAGRTLLCGHEPACPVAPVSVSNRALEELPTFTPNEAASESGLPSKVKSLIADLERQPSDVKSIVFSTWKMTLDVIERALRKAGMTSVRFDGGVSQKDRQPLVEKFRKDPGVSVMLLTLSCGAVGCGLVVRNVLRSH